MSDENKEPDWKELELLVAEIQKQLSPDATVKHNVQLDGVDSETNRQLDVLIEQRIGQYLMRIVIDCKDYSKPVDVKGIEEFQGLVHDVRAHKGALVCPSGFTKSAKKRARKLQIDLYSPVDTGEHKWKVKVKAPVVCDFRSMKMGYGISTTEPKPFKIPNEFYKLPVYDESGNEQGTLLDASLKCWDNGELSTEEGRHDKAEIFGDQVVLIDNGYGDRVKVNLWTHYIVKKQLYLGQLGIDEIKGLKDEHTGFVVTNAFTTEHLDALYVQNNWKKIDKLEEADVEPVFVISGLHCYGIQI